MMELQNQRARASDEEELKGENKMIEGRESQIVPIDLIVFS